MDRARFYSTMVSAASLKVMDFYNDKKRFKFLLDVFICNLIVVVVLCSCSCYKHVCLASCTCCAG